LGWATFRKTSAVLDLTSKGTLNQCEGMRAGQQTSQEPLPLCGYNVSQRSCALPHSQNMFPPGIGVALIIFGVKIVSCYPRVLDEGGDAIGGDTRDVCCVLMVLVSKKSSFVEV